MDTQEFNRIFAKNLNRYLSRYGMKQVDLAKAIGVSTSTVNTWVKGQKSPRMSKVDDLCKLFRCTRDDLASEGEPIIITDDYLERIEVYEQLNEAGKRALRMYEKYLLSLEEYRISR